MKTLQEIVSRQQNMLKWVLDSEAANDRRSWVFPAELDGERGIKRVTNLGWLIRHNNDVINPLQGVTFLVKGWRYGKRIGIPSVGPLTIEHFRPVLFANMNDDRTYACQFMDAMVLRDWLDRPSFHGYLINWDLNPGSSTTCTIGTAEYLLVDVNQRVPTL
jgi:hypothetical protein